MTADADARLLEAERLVAQGELGTARDVLASLLAIRPGHARAWLQRSYVESLAGRYRAARECALRAHALRPTDDATLQELVRRLRTFNEAAAIGECLQGLPPLDRVRIPVLLSLAAQLSYLNEQPQALALLDEAQRGDPDYPPTLVSRAQVLTYLGRFDDAEADLRRCVRLAPELASAWWQLARVRRQTAASNHIDAIRRQLSVPGRKADDVALLAFALHKEYDDLGDVAQAWQALELGCRAKRSTLRYRSDDTRALVDGLIAWSDTQRDARDHATEGEATATPVFVVGMHRSGTTLLEQLLDGHSQVRGLGELYDVTAQMRQATDHHCRGVIDATVVARAADVDFAQVGRGYLEGVAWRLGNEHCFTDKLPSNFLNLGFICRALPQAKILHMRREPMETCFSNLRELFSDANAYSYDQRELAAYYRQYDRLMAHWRARFGGRIHDVDYGRLTTDPESVMREVAAFCGLAYEPAMLDPQASKRGVATASAVQVRSGIQARAQAKWRTYEPWLGPLHDALAAPSG